MHIGWISIGNDNYGSTRIGVTNIHKGLLNNGYQSTVLNYNKNFSINIEADINDLKKRIIEESITVVVFHKVFSQKTLELVEFCKDNKVKTVFANGDWNENPMHNTVDHVISGSPYTRDIIKNKYGVKNSHYIDDALETSWHPIKERDVSSGTVNLGWFGNFTKLKYAKDFITSLNLSDYKLSTVSNAPCKYTSLKADHTMGAATDKPWDTDFLIRFLINTIDIIVIPLDLSDGDLIKHYAKTANRVTFAMSLGIPVIATPIPSYELVIENGVNGFLASTAEEWKSALFSLRGGYQREAIGKHSTFDIRNKYHVDNIIKDWINIFKA